jgi:hypothetical protein
MTDEEKNPEIAAKCQAILADMIQLRAEMLARLDQLEAMMEQNHEALMRQVQRYGR